MVGDRHPDRRGGPRGRHRPRAGSGPVARAQRPSARTGRDRRGAHRQRPTCWRGRAAGRRGRLQQGAICERVRAIAAELDERGVLRPLTGRTADEFAAEAGQALPPYAADLRGAALLFDEVRYGQRVGSLARLQATGHRARHADQGQRQPHYAARAARAGPCGQRTAMTTATQPCPGVQPADPGPYGGPGPVPGPGRRDGWRRWRGTATVAALILLGGLAVALLQLRPPVAGVLDPNDPGPAGAHALVALLIGRGQTVIRTGTVPAAAAAVEPQDDPGHHEPTASRRRSSLATLARVRASLLIVAPTVPRSRRARPRCHPGRAREAPLGPPHAVRPARRPPGGQLR